MRPAILRHIAPLALALAVFSPAAASPEEKPLSEAELARLKTDANYDNAAQYRLGMLYLRGDRGVARDRARAESLLKNAALQGNAEAAYELGFLISTTPGADGDQAMKWLRIAANKDMPKAQYALGDLYVHFGEPGLAVEWYGKAAAQGHVAAKRQLGTLLLLGQGVRKDEQRGLALLREAAEKGDTDAQYKLCGAYQTGLGVAKDEKTALDWLKKAAAGGHPQAQFLLGDNLLYGGPTLAQNKAEAMRWLGKAAEQGHVKAQTILGICLSTGNGVAKDGQRGLALLREAAEKGDAEAQYNLFVGLFPQDKTALRWLDLAVAQGHVRAQGALGGMLMTGDGVAKDAKRGVALLLEAARKGDAEAQCNLFVSYRTGDGVPKDEKTATDWLKKAAEAGLARAQFFLGHDFANGSATLPQDTQAALNWFGKAAAQGHVEAQKHLDDLRKKLSDLPAQAEAGDAKAQLDLGLFLLKKDGEENRTAGAQWVRKAADQGNKIAMMALGVIYSEGTGVPKSDIEAEKWLKRSGEAVGCAAHCLLGQIYTRDQGVKPDDVEAYARFSLSAEKVPAGDNGAKVAQYSAKRRDELAAKLGPRLDEAKARLKALKAELAAPKEPTATP